MTEACPLDQLSHQVTSLTVNVSRYEYRVEMVHHASPDSSRNIVREFGEDNLFLFVPDNNSYIRIPKRLKSEWKRERHFYPKLQMIMYL